MKTETITRHLWHVLADDGSKLGHVRRFVGETSTLYEATYAATGEIAHFDTFEAAAEAVNRYRPDAPASRTAALDLDN